MAMYITTASLLVSGYVIPHFFGSSKEILEKLTLVHKEHLSSIFDIAF